MDLPIILLLFSSLFLLKRCFPLSRHPCMLLIQYNESQQHSCDISSRLETEVWRDLLKVIYSKTKSTPVVKSAVEPRSPVSDCSAWMSACPSFQVVLHSVPKYKGAKLRVGKNSNQVAVHRKEYLDFISRTGEHNWSQGVVVRMNRNWCNIASLEALPVLRYDSSGVSQ